MVLCVIVILKKERYGGGTMAIFWAIMAPFMGTALIGQLLEPYITGAESVFDTIAWGMLYVVAEIGEIFTMM